MEIDTYQATAEDIVKLQRVENLVRERQMRGLLNESFDLVMTGCMAGVDIRPIIEYITELCKTKNYKARGHFKCTKDNVVPEYERKGTAMVNFDHLEGLHKILAVDMGLCEDF